MPSPVIMEEERFFHMNKGLGEASYAQNSSLQKRSMETFKDIIINAALNSHATSETPERMVMADLGCATGRNSLLLLEEIVEAISKRNLEAGTPKQEFIVFLNDLPSNDFNAMFTNLPEFIERMRSSSNGAEIFFAGVPGTFYGRLFGKESLHFVSSTHGLHWLSQVPPGLFDDEGKPINKGHVLICETSSPDIKSAYLRQFQKDFNLFLRSRSAELKPRGGMALLMRGRRTQDYQDSSAYGVWNIFAKSFAHLVTQGVVEENKVDSYNVPLYVPSTKEIEDEVHKEGSFEIEHIEACEWNLSSGDPKKDVQVLTMTFRAFQESLLKHHFGEEIIEPLFQTFSRLLAEARTKGEIKTVHLLVVLKKLARAAIEV